MKSSKALKSLYLALFVAILSGTWDAWWHVAIGRESILQPPHLLLYISVIAAITCSIILWKKDAKFKWISGTLLLIPLTAPFDELWHRMYGVENVSTLAIVWSPPHIILILSLIVSTVMALRTLHLIKDNQEIYGGMMSACILSLSLFLLAPFQPEGGWHIAGFFGAGIGAFTIIFILLIAQKYIKHMLIPIISILFYISIISIEFGVQPAPGVIIAPHEHVPPFIMIFALLSLGSMLSLDFKPTLKGAVAGLAWSTIIYGFGWYFLSSTYQYSIISGTIAVVSSVLGGLIAGKIIEWKK